MLGNKGGVAISLKYGETLLGFVNCHLAAHQDMVERRNEDYREIVGGLQVGTLGMG
jgi:phosphatidylinositol-bisphosphatase